MFYANLNFCVFLLASAAILLLTLKKTSISSLSFRPLYLATFLGIAWLISVSFFSIIEHEKIIFFLETYIAPDGEISNPKFQIMLVSITPILTLAKLVFLLFTLEKFQIKNNLLKIYFIFFSTHLIGYIYLNQAFHEENSFHEDSFLEWATFFLSLIASILFLIRGILGSKFSLLCCAAFLLFAMEEISWGQRIFKIESPEFFIQNNFQRELNLHNFFNPILGIIYLLLNLILVCCLTWFQQVKFFSKFYNFPEVNDFIASSNKFGLWIFPAFLIFMNFNPGGELIEEQWAFFGFIFSLIILKDYFLEEQKRKIP